MATICSTQAAEFYVSPAGDDASPGSRDKPFATLAKARDAARSAETPATIHVRSGTYALEAQLTLTPADSGLTIRAYKDEKPVIHGARAITGWRQLTTAPAGIAAAAKGKLWVADIPKGWRFHYLYVDGQTTRRARMHDTHWRQWPQNVSYEPPGKDGQKLTFDDKSILAHLPSNGDVEMICIMAQYGVMGNGVLADIDPEAGTAKWNSTQIYVGFGTRRKNFTFENALPFLDQPGEWCVDSQNGKVYLWPEKEISANTEAIAPKLYELIRMQGDESNGAWVENVTIKGLTLMYTDRLPEDQWPDSWLRRQWEHVDAMVYLQGAKNCMIADNRLLYSGSSGITLDQFCQGIRVDGNEIGWSGSDGVFLCGYGPGTLDVNRDNTIVRNWIHDMGLGNYWHSACVQIYQSGHNRIALNLLQNSAYTPISIVGTHPEHMSMLAYFFEDDPANRNVQYRPWTAYRIRAQDFPQDIQDGIRNGTYQFDRETIKPYLHSRNNVIEFNIVVEPEQLLDEGGAIYAWCPGKGNVWKDNLIYKSSGMPGSSILALDDLAEYFTITGNVIWVNGKAACGTIGMRPNERGNVIRDNIRAAYLPEHADGVVGNVDGIKGGFYRADTSRGPVYAMEKRILNEVNKAGGWPGNPETGISRPGEPIMDAKQRTLEKGAHKTIETVKDGAGSWSETEEQFAERMQWFHEARFGMFIHWGAYSVLGRGEWVQHIERIPFKEYEAVAASFNPVAFDAARIVDLARTAGMKYLVITAKHHDGFCMWPTALTDYNIVDWTPFKRDPLAELAAECRKQGIKFGVYYSPRDWHHPDWVLRYEDLGGVYQYGSSMGYRPSKWTDGKPGACGNSACMARKPMTKEVDPRPTEAEGADMNRYLDYMMGQIEELLTRYEPDVLWFDGADIQDPKLAREDELFAMIRRLRPEIIVNDRYRRGTGDFESIGHENRLPAQQPPRDWEACEGITHWGYRKGGRSKSAANLVRMLVEAASMGGNLLLNIGPDGQGEVPGREVETLREMGQWMDVNGESIYGCGPAGMRTPQWGRITARDGKYYLHVFAWPKDGRLIVESFEGKVTKAYLLADTGRTALKTTLADGVLTIELPEKAPDPIATVLCVEKE